MDICGCSCFTWLITACRSGTEVAVRLFLTRCSPRLTAHKSVLSRPLSLQGLEPPLALLAQTQLPLVSHIPAESRRAGWEPDCALDRLALVASLRLPVGAQSSASIRDYGFFLACCISFCSCCCSIPHWFGDVDFGGGVVTWVQSSLNLMSPYAEGIMSKWQTIWCEPLT